MFIHDHSSISVLVLRKNGRISAQSFALVWRLLTVTLELLSGIHSLQMKLRLMLCTWCQRELLAVKLNKTRSRKVTSVRRLPVKAVRETRSGLSCRMVWSAWVLGPSGVWPAHPKLPLKVALPEPENRAVLRGADEWSICRGGLAHRVSVAESFLQGRCASFGWPTPCVSPFCLVGRETEWR